MDGLISVDICIFFAFMQKLYLEKANNFEKLAPWVSDQLYLTWNIWKWKIFFFYFSWMNIFSKVQNRENHKSTTKPVIYSKAEGWIRQQLKCSNKSQTKCIYWKLYPSYSFYFVELSQVNSHFKQLSHWDNQRNYKVVSRRCSDLILSPFLQQIWGNRKC